MWLGLRLGASVSRGTAPLPRAPLRHPGSGCSHSWSMPLYMKFQELDLSPLHSYISTIIFFAPRGLAFFSFLCVLGQDKLRAWGSKENERVTDIFRRYTSRPKPRLTYTRTVSNLKKFYLIYLFLTNTILNLYLSVAAPKFSLGGT